jgi:integrase
MGMYLEKKPRLNYAECFAVKKENKFTVDTVAWLLQKLMDERAAPGGRPMGESHICVMRLVQRSPIGAKPFATLRPVDFIDHCKKRRSSGVLPQTIAQDMAYLSGALKYASEIWELPGAEQAHAAYRKKAKPQLMREQLISKSQPRDRRPTQDELDRLLALAATDDVRPQNQIKMVPVIKFSYLTARRISETCRLRWGDVDHEKRLCLVRDLKNPKGKGFHDAFPLLGEAYDIVMAQPRLTADPAERIFKFRARSCSARYTIMKRHLGIKNLRLHDNRREAISRLFEQGFNVPEVAKMSLHRNPAILLRTYTSLRAEDLHLGPAAKRAAP